MPTLQNDLRSGQTAATLLRGQMPDRALAKKAALSKIEWCGTAVSDWHYTGNGMTIANDVNNERQAQFVTNTHGCACARHGVSKSAK
jgi:hypothetical protein